MAKRLFLLNKESYYSIYVDYENGLESETKSFNEYFEGAAECLQRLDPEKIEIMKPKNVKENQPEFTVKKLILEKQ